MVSHFVISLRHAPGIFSWLACFLLVAAPLAAAEETGEQIFRTMCAKCHGTHGEGVEDSHPDPLVGERSVEELAALIDKTMPEGAPEKCDAEQSRKVAAYIYEAFYS